MYQDDFPHEEYPVGIMKVGISKTSRLRGLVQRYAEIGFKDYDMVEIAGLSLTEWRDKKYPIPHGYKASWGRYLKKHDLKSNPFVK